MDTHSEQLLALGKKLLSQLELLHDSLRQQSQAAQSQNKREEQNERVRPFWFYHVLTLYKKSKREESAQQDRQHSTQKSIKWATWCAFFAVLLYALVTLKIWIANQKASDAAEHAADTASIALANSQAAFRIDERPYLWLTKNQERMQLFQVPNATTGQITWNWHITNYGKTPAHNVRFYQYISLNHGPYIPSYGSRGRATIGTPLPPTAESFDTVISGIIKQSYFSRLQKILDGVRIRVRIEYEDGFHTPYETGICLGNLQEPFGRTSFSYCEGNYIK